MPCAAGTLGKPDAFGRVAVVEFGLSCRIAAVAVDGGAGYELGSARVIVEVVTETVTVDGALSTWVSLQISRS